MHNLTEHFTLEELTYSYTAKQYNIDNRPNKFQISELTRLCKNILEPIRQKTGKPIIISSNNFIGFHAPVNEIKLSDKHLADSNNSK